MTMTSVKVRGGIPYQGFYLSALGMLDRIAQFIDENVGGNAAPSNYVDSPLIGPFSGTQLLQFRRDANVISGAAIGVYPSDRKPAARASVAPQAKPAPAAAPPAAAAAPSKTSLTAEPNVRYHLIVYSVLSYL